MSCCLARSDDKREGREGVGDFSRHGSDKIDWESPELVFELVNNLPWGVKASGRIESIYWSSPETET